MEPVFTLTSYLQLREQLRVSLTPFTRADCESLPEQGQNRMIGAEPSSKYLAEAPNSPVPPETDSGELVNLEDAFLAISEELNFDLPEPSRVDRIKAGLMKATIVLLLFVGLLVSLLAT
jgi:hypothetical protein